MEHAIFAEGLRKRYGKVEALRGVDISVPRGAVLGMLGPNGAGKTTTIRIFSTLLQPDEGHATVAGFDVVKDPEKVRQRIGLAGQNVTLDNRLTGRENLKLIGVLHGLKRPAAKARAAELLERFELTDAADRVTQTYSGGMRRRLDLAACVLAHPAVLFLDEPTIGLDPASRQVLWRLIREHVAQGATVLLTTQYLEEVDELTDHVLVVDKGQVIAYGTSDELKRRVGGERLEVAPVLASEVPTVVAALGRVAAAEPVVAGSGLSVSVPLTGGVADVAVVAMALSDAGVELADFAVRRPSLVEVFLNLTDQSTELQRSAA